MKNIIKTITLVIILTTAASVASAQKNTQSSTFKVWGNCETCKETIESSLHVKGVKNADWSESSKMITVEYDSTKISLQKIHQLIAASGYDTELEKGSDKAYSELVPCCRYIRKQE